VAQAVSGRLRLRCDPHEDAASVPGPHVLVARAAQAAKADLDLAAKAARSGREGDEQLYVDSAAEHVEMLQAFPATQH